MSQPPFPSRTPDWFSEEFPQASPSATEAGTKLVIIGTQLLSLINRSRRTVTDLGATASQVLVVIEGAREPLPPHVIAERLLITSGTMTSLLDTLERRDLIRRIPHPDDRRKLLIDITPEARDIVDALLPRVHATLRKALAPLSENERQSLTAMLSRIQSRLAALEDEEIDFSCDTRNKAAVKTPNGGTE